MEYKTAMEIMMAESNQNSVERIKRFIEKLDVIQAEEYREMLISEMKDFYEKNKQVIEMFLSQKEKR